MVTVWGTFQLPDVKVSIAGKTVPSVSLLETTLIATSWVGIVFSLTVKVAVCPASLVTKPLIGKTDTPALSSSSLTTSTLGITISS